MADWYVGQKAVYVDDREFLSGTRRPAGMIPVKGVVYTVREVMFSFGGTLSLALIELPGFLIFSAWRFRPVVSNDTDISIFTEILDRVNAREVIDA